MRTKRPRALQLRLRARLHDQVVALGPAWFGVERTSDALLTLTEGVEQLETYFGQFLPQLFVAALTPLVIFGLMAGFDLPLAAILLAFAWLALLAPAAFARWEAKTSLKRRDAYHRLAAEFLDAVQGLATLKSFGQAAARSRRPRIALPRGLQSDALGSCEECLHPRELRTR